MYWTEESEEEAYQVPDDVLDMTFSIRCDTLPVDHAWALSRAIRAVLPWFGEEPRCGLHIIHVADSGNGWERPQGASDLLYPSRRTKLVLRLPAARIDDARALCGEILDVDGNPLRVLSAKTRLLALTPILYSRYVASETGWSEDEFMHYAVGELKRLRLRFKKVLCGKDCTLTTPDGALPTRSLMVANMPFEDAVTLQEEGIGRHYALGCGLFIPQKSF
ncbi:MAG: type I-MYXAN CRISPR-associated protein Cas6/Cmx6 [Candidatus Sedimenticola endophacoides]|uniref:Type I-MYXAN CRISPR-associated protein Cas6/Cmx6 n=1 Tax=Candidatus Sedimenticola endophacoides TaxID=2548426 RepID=A0A657PYY2_9GAMM|nr:MAG: type I-MYXAN CRISPR-associated protein Cas6/Cmx6 [Candidatus Sedimenticola endophacoides]OQX34578.1 MAG: type I-MYXAN CRISPR-associated protein Cas6/Cmx6 [Candidatus Sedimenticola endophacoides]OQX36025.1 MAG: type I-MYXAN CRISPR-associated protein Cas6/Cmx6 [Candidatus Sedimenticola endophacoides]OQX41124.1 MAG: type I-MYXAN CRISPR-associated protein Cas6/Cmx6 [Candidatus Sedimenticola endophacoides]OQX42324.1 MAG: type I-MYXAN CRISPR-associated protein Cas6/Cmx6 [Candidatus Sedimentic